MARFKSDYGVRAERLGGGARVFRTITEAARDLGVKPSSVSHAMRSGGICRGNVLAKVPRIWLVRTVDDEFMACRREGDAFVAMDRARTRLFPEDVMTMKEITASVWGE